jgi:putative serine/threonine protein kinase
MPILGKGCVGLVVKAIHSQKGLCALKIRRIDADRADMSREASFHSTANTLAVGPKLHDYSRNFMLMDLIEGEKIGSWASKRVSVRRARIIAKSILFQCHKLDAAGLDHGELSRISNHVLISGDSAIIVDFESASTSRKVSNVTSATQALFLYGKIAGKIIAAIGKPDREEVLTALRRYKRDISMDNLEAVLKLLL